MRVMALDVGEKTIGIAISDDLLMTAQSRPTLRRTNFDADMRHLRRLVEENEVQEVVVGNPLHMTGREGRQSKKAAAFARRLSEMIGIRVVMWDERLTSVAAEEHLRDLGLKWRQRRKHIDQIAAMLILQNYLENRRA